MAGIQVDSALVKYSDAKNKQGIEKGQKSKTFTHALKEWNETEEEREEKMLEDQSDFMWIFRTVTSSHELL